MRLRRQRPHSRPSPKLAQHAQPARLPPRHHPCLVPSTQPHPAHRGHLPGELELRRALPPLSGATGWSDQDAVAQVDAHGAPIARLPQPLPTGREEPYASGDVGTPDPRFPGELPLLTFDLTPFVAPSQLTGDLIHAFYTEQAEIHGGRMDRFVAGSDNPGLVLGCYDASDFPEGKLAREFTLCDHCFHSAFGGSFLNHQWMIAARTPPWPDDVPVPEAWRSRVPGGLEDIDHLQDRPLSQDGKFIVNTAQLANRPAIDGPRQPRLFDYRTIGDALDEVKLAWAWYAGGWRTADAGGGRLPPPRSVPGPPPTLPLLQEVRRGER